MAKLTAGKSLMTLNTRQILRDSDDDSSITEIPTSIASKPTPLQLETFIPWVCSQWCASTSILVKRDFREDYIKYDSKKPSPKATRKGGRQKNITIDDAQTTAEKSSKEASKEGIGKDFGLMPDRIIVIKAFYNSKNQLVEISIVGSTIKISRKVIHAISLCVPFHSTLTRLTIRRGGLTDEMVYEIHKLLPYSNITEICFDDSFIREANYHILLEEISQLSYLSLNRCRINDQACQKIAMNIDFGYSAASTLQVLELGTNELTDDSAKSFGLVLMKNRCLLHLNLSGNRITDEGFKAIMDSLKQFPLDYVDVMQMKRRRLIYLKNKTAVYLRCLRDLKYGGRDDAESNTSSKKMLFAARRLRRRSKRQMTEDTVTDADQAEIMAKSIVGEFKDPFGTGCIVIKDGYFYSKGNMVFCSLNMAYNSLEFPSVWKLNEVLAYQSELEKMSSETGLIRVTLDGNYIPSSSVELNEIDNYLKKILPAKNPSPRKTRTSSLLRKLLTTKTQGPTTRF